MDNLVIYDVEQGSEAWHELRCGRFTASKFKDLMASTSTATYQGLIDTIVGEILSETTEPTYSNDIMQRGIDLEDEAADLYESINEIPCEKIGFVTNDNVFPDYVGVSPDRVVGDGILEIKCPLMKTHISYLRKGVLPNVYKWQVQGQLLVTDAEYCDFMSYYPNIKPFILRVLPNVEMQNELKNRIESSIDLIKQILKEID